MKFENLQNKPDEVFRRLLGVKRATFEKMVELVKEAYDQKHRKGGRPHSLSPENRVAMTLEYLREYRTYAHIAATFEVSDRCAFDTIKCVENILIKAKEFALPGKKALTSSDFEIEVILIDASETPIERPKKTSRHTTRARKNGTQ